MCPHCELSFVRLTHLQAHVRTHLPESAKPFVCSKDGCDKRFWTPQHVRRHEEGCGEGRYQVSSCFYSQSRASLDADPVIDRFSARFAPSRSPSTTFFVRTTPLIIPRQARSPSPARIRTVTSRSRPRRNCGSTQRSTTVRPLASLPKETFGLKLSLPLSQKPAINATISHTPRPPTLIQPSRPGPFSALTSPLPTPRDAHIPNACPVRRSSRTRISRRTLRRTPSAKWMMRCLGRRKAMGSPLIGGGNGQGRRMGRVKESK